MPPQQSYEHSIVTDFDMDIATFDQGPSKVAVIGNGCVGLPLCVLIKDCGHIVTGIDANKAQVEQHNQGKSTIDDVQDHELQGIAFTSDPNHIEDNDV